jgi:cell division septal protein FtsQ
MQQKRDLLNSAKIKQKKRKTFKRRIIFLCVFFVVLLIGLSFLSKIKAFAITDIVVSGNAVIETDAIKQIAEENLSGNYLHLFSRSDFLIYPRKSIENAIMASSLRIASAEVSLDGKHTLAIAITEREPKFTWCGLALPVDNSPQRCYFLDTTGFAFAPAPYFSGDIYFKFYGPLDPADVQLGAQFLDSETINAILAASQSFHDFGWKPYALAIDANGDYELSIESPDTTPVLYPKIIFRKDNDPATIASNLSAALAVEPFATKMKKEFASLIYIDLRYDNKVYYKFRT